MKSKRNVRLVPLTQIMDDVLDGNGCLPDDPAHPSVDGSARYPVGIQGTCLLRHDATDEFVSVRVGGVYVDDGLTGTIVELGPWSMSPLEARQLGDTLRDLAAAADPRLAAIAADIPIESES